METLAEFLTRVVEMFREHQSYIGARYKLDMLPDEVTRVVTAAYFASMIPNEGRYPNVCLMCYRADDPRDYHFAFSERCPVTDRNIARWAEAVGNRRHLYCVSGNRSHPGVPK